MTIALVTHVTNTGGTGTTAAANTTGANLLVLGATGPESSSYTGGADSKSNTWTNGSFQKNDAGAIGLGLDYVLTPTTDAAQTFTTAPSNIFYEAVMAAAFSGVGTLDQVPAGVSDTNSATSHPSSAPVTPSANGCLLVAFIGFGSDPGTLTVPTGFTLLDQSITGTYLDAAMAYEIQTTATARTPTWTSSNTVNSTGAAVVFLSGAVAPPPVGSLGEFDALMRIAGWF